MIATPSRPDRPLLVVLSIIAALVVVALAVVFSRGEPAPLDASTPEGVVQRYAAAVLSVDEARAALYLSPEAVDTCVAGNPSAPTDSMRIALASTTVRGDTADVVITMTTTFNDGLFGSSSYESDGTVSLVQADGSWRIMSVPWELTVYPMPEVTK